MFRLLILFAIFFITACIGGKSAAEQDRITEVMITFIQKSKAGFWEEAMESITPNERSEMMEGGHVLPEYKAAVNRIRLSTVKNMDLSLDRRGRLVGLKDILDDANEMSKASDERVIIDPSKLEDLAAWRKKREEEAAKKASEEPAVEEKPTWLDAYYGNTKSGGGGLKDMKRNFDEDEEED